MTDNWSLCFRTKLIYPEFIRGRDNDELSAESSEEEDSAEREEILKEQDPDYDPRYYDDENDYAPKGQKEKRRRAPHNAGGK